MNFITINRWMQALRLKRHGLGRHMRVFSHTSLNERLALYRLARSMPTNARAMEIGSHIGSSALFLCAGLSHQGGHLICVDTWMNQTMPDGQKDTFAEFEANTAPYADMIRPIRKFSSELIPSDLGGPLDLVFIDGDHSEAAVRADLTLVAQWIKPGGMLAFHDACANFPGVVVVVGEALASRDWDFVQWVDSLAVIRRRTDVGVREHDMLRGKEQAPSNPQGFRASERLATAAQVAG